MSTMDPVAPLGPPLDALVAALAAELRSPADGRRTILGIVGAPGSGKTTLAAALADRLGHDQARVLPMDGFHLALEAIEGTPLLARRGAADTFDAAGFVWMLRRIRTADEPVVYAPAFRRGLEEPIAGSIAIPREVPVVIVEGLYLLLDAPPWNAARSLFDQTWFVQTPEETRVRRLIARHVSSGMTPDRAGEWASTTDASSARVVEVTRARADRVIAWN